MLSRLAIRQGALGKLMLNQVAKPTAISARGFQDDVRPGETELSRQIRQWDEANAMFYGPERDLKNFPTEKQKVQPAPVKLGFIPQTWFDAFYEKTGVTGPYLLGTGFVMTVLSKELWVVEHGFSEFISFWIMLLIINKKWGANIGEYFSKQADLHTQKRLIDPLLQSKSKIDDQVVSLQTLITQLSASDAIFEAKKENLALQLEEEYRRRMNEAQLAIKKRLDYQVEMESARKRFEHKHMVDWIVSSVVKGITPQQEKESINQCITDLKKLAV